MTYVYRDTKRLRRHPVVIARTPPPAPPDPAAETPSAQPDPKPVNAPAPTPKPRKNPKPLPPPVWGGRLGLELAYFEVCDWERRNPRHQLSEREHS